MEVLRYDDPEAFRRDAAAVLMADPARNNLPAALANVLVSQPQVYPAFHLWIAAEGGEPKGVALQTEPHNLVLAEPLAPEAVPALARGVLDDGGPLPGVIANVPWCDRFAEHVEAATGRRAHRTLSEGVWELTQVHEPPRPAGRARPASADDRELVRRWFIAFEDEALPASHPRDEARRRMQIDLALEGAQGGIWLWWSEDGMPVSLVGFREVPGLGSRIGPVYTPPGLRRRGYAARLVAELSADRLAAGDPACYLYTDLANPTSNAIYARVGYVKLCEAVEYAFDEPG